MKKTVFFASESNGNMLELCGKRNLKQVHVQKNVRIKFSFLDVELIKDIDLIFCNRCIKLFCAFEIYLWSHITCCSRNVEALNQALL